MTTALATPVAVAQPVLALRERYRRSVDLVRDFNRPDGLQGYIVTTLAAESLRRIVAGLAPRSTQRAWSLVGPYGAGKSAFALLVAHALDGQDGAVLDGVVYTQLASISAETAALLPGTAATSGGPKAPSLLPVLIVGDRQSSLAGKIVHALLAVLPRVWKGRRTGPYRELLRLSEVLETRGEEPAPRELAQLLLAVCERLAEAEGGPSGIFLVVDEFGKHLERSVLRGAWDDAYLMQTLAEAAARSGSAPLVVVSIQHQNVEAYATSAPEAVLNEWRKVQGRYEQINYQESGEQMLALLASAFARPEGWAPSSEHRQVVEAGLERCRAQMPTLPLAQLREYLLSLVPIHPLAATALPSLFKRLGQQERSLFAFMASDEPGGLSEFVRTEGDGDWYRLHHLFDYLSANLRSTLLSGTAGKRWSELEAAVGRHVRSAEELITIKTVGLLGLLGELSPMRADIATLAYALEDLVTDPGAVIAHLAAASVLVKRSFSDSYALWEGSDVDIEDRLAEASLHVSAEPARALSHYLPARAVVARRHSIQTGTLRYFDVAYLSKSEEIEGFLTRLEAGAADGLILLYARPEDGAGAARLLNVLGPLRARTSRPVVLGVIDQPSEVRTIIAYLECLDWVRANTPALSGDPVARRELAARRQVADVRLRTALGGGRVGDAVRAFASAARWYDEEGRPAKIVSERSLNAFLSAVCRRVYCATPEITNELINRRALSSAAAKAQRILLGAMVEVRTERRLGIEGAPPELSMYYSLLEKPGLHVELHPRAGLYRFMDLREHSDVRWRALGEAVDTLLGESGTRVSLDKLMGVWSRPPFGLKAGVLPILLAQVLLSREDELALYEGDMFLPELSAPVLERIAKIPATFSMRSIPSSGLTPELVQELVPVLRQTELSEDIAQPGLFANCGGEEETGRPGLLCVVRPWVQFVASLPEITQGTQHLSPEAREIRDIVLRTSDPLQLLFGDLPRVLRCSPADDPARFAERLRRVLRELRTYYDPRVLDEIFEAVVRAVGEDPADERARQRIAERSAALFNVISEHRLKAFLFRLRESRTSQSTWCESVASMVAQKPPQKWNDEDLKAFHVELGSLGRRMRSAETAAFEPGPDGAAVVAQPGALHVHLAATTATGEQYADIVRIAPAQAEMVQALSSRLHAWLRENVADAELRKAVLVRGWQDVISEAQDPIHAGD